MKVKIRLIILIITILTLFVNWKACYEDKFAVYKVDLKKQDLRLYWKNEKRENFGSIQNLKNWIETNNLKLGFAMNAGMYKTDHSPQGLYIEKGKTLTILDTTKATGNFYLKPNGVFFLKNNKTAEICTTENFKNDKNITYATQSGPMLIIDGQIHPEFKEGSKNLNIRNGVGI